MNIETCNGPYCEAGLAAWVNLEGVFKAFALNLNRPSTSRCCQTFESSPRQARTEADAGEIRLNA